MQVLCSCSQRVKVEDAQAGRTVRCPSCQALVSVPGQPKEEGVYGVEQKCKCPHCKHEWPLDTVVCIKCGYRFDTGRKMQTRYDFREGVLTRGPAGLGCCTRYHILRGKRGKPCLKVSHRFLFVPLGSTIYKLNDYQTIRTDFTCGVEDSPVTYYLELAGGQKCEIFRFHDEDQFRELIDLLAQAGRLKIMRGIDHSQERKNSVPSYSDFLVPGILIFLFWVLCFVVSGYLLSYLP